MMSAEARRRLPRLVASVAIVLLTGACTTVGPDFEPPEAPVAPDWYQEERNGLTSTGTELVAWWEIFNDPKLNRLVEEAHRVGLKVMSHAQSEAGIQLALRNGVDTIEHAIYLDAETIDLLLEKDAVVVPTFAIVNVIVHFGRAAGLPEYAMKKAEESHKAHLESIRRAFEAGVKIALGTDFAGPVGVAHGNNAVELEILVNQVGMSPMQAIASGTRIAAEALGLEDEIGTLSPGKKADLLMVAGDPSEDVTILKQKAAIELVMKSGEIVVDRR